MRLHATLLSTASAVAVLVAAASPAAAQSGGGGSAASQTGAPSQSAASAASKESGTPQSVDEIVVTAQKRTQNLQDVPIVVTTVSRQLLQDTGVNDIKDLQVVTPGLLVTSTTSEGTTTARIRGIGTVGDNVGLESSVGISIDGVYRPRNGVGFGDLGDVDRIEVLKGPQGTLFGKSTSAGVINILTAQPAFDFGAHAEFTAGNYGEVGGSASVTGPIVGDKLAGSFYFADRQRDGFNRVADAPGPSNQTRDNDRNFYTLRGQLLWLPTDDLSVRTIVDYSHRDEHCCDAVQIRSAGSGSPPVGETAAIVAALGGAGGGEAINPNPFARQEFANRPDTQNIIDRGLSVETNYKLHTLGDATFTNIASVRDWKLVHGGDVDFTTADLFYQPGTDLDSDEFQTISEEARVSGKIDRLDYTVGVFYSHEHLRSNFNFLFGPSFTPYLSLLFSGGTNPAFLPQTFGANQPANTGDFDRYRQDDDTVAVFTNDTFHITSKLEFNAGFRFTHDDKSLDSLQTNTGNAGLCAPVNRGVGAIIGKVPAATAAGLATIDAVSCLPILSPGFNNFSNHQSEVEDEASGTAKLSYRFNPELLVYGSYARGYKAGGFNLDRTQCTIGTPGCAPGSAAAVTPLASTRFAPEFVDSYELGAKSTLLDRKLLLNGTLFRQEFDNFQYNTFNGLVFVVTSVPEVVSQGVDTDFVWFPIHDMSIQGGLTIADTRFQNKDLGALQPAGYQGSGGSRLPLAPLYSASLAATYTHDLIGDYRVRGNFGIKFNSAYNTGSDLDPGKRQGDYALLNARIAFFPRNERYSIEFWADNLTNKDYRQVVFDAGFQNAPTNRQGVLDAFLGSPRTYGVTLRAKY